MIIGENLNTLYTWEILLWLANLSIHSVSDLYFIIDKVLNDWDNLHWPSICCLASWSLVFVAQLIILHISCDYVSTQVNLGFYDLTFMMFGKSNDDNFYRQIVWEES